MFKNHPYPHFQSKKVMVKHGTYKNMKWNICKRARLTFRNVIKMYTFRNAFDTSSKETKEKQGRPKTRAKEEYFNCKWWRCFALCL